MSYSISHSYHYLHITFIGDSIQKAVCFSLMLQGPVVYGGKIMDRFKPTDKVKIILATATVMNKPQGQMSREQAWNHSAETRIKADDDDKLLVNTPCCICLDWLCNYHGRCQCMTSVCPGPHCWNGCYRCASTAVGMISSLHKFLVLFVLSALY